MKNAVRRVRRRAELLNQKIFFRCTWPKHTRRPFLIVHRKRGTAQNAVQPPRFLFHAQIPQENTLHFLEGKRHTVYGTFYGSFV
ncbi:hypothetical protein [Faecalibacterium sp. I4-1-79]|uniref:hypothetical protein n=1 Tax=Faecalibacterium sp. I4-1-79 TaxID=2929494 RepID=UPI002014B4CB|nr:hypothetical protein [Faecalibacterium sp. I4-1-79]UQK40266.1 hypothetical protein MTP36_00125 [Faecalibacterium sp. I4-1-79]